LTAANRPGKGITGPDSIMIFAVATETLLLMRIVEFAELLKAANSTAEAIVIGKGISLPFYAQYMVFRN
jgi:hypothetical protein